MLPRADGLAGYPASLSSQAAYSTCALTRPVRWFGPAPSPAAMIGWTARANDWSAGGARGTIAGLAFGVGHGCITDRFARQDSSHHAVARSGLVGHAIQHTGVLPSGLQRLPAQRVLDPAPTANTPASPCGKPRAYPPTAGHHRPAPAGWRPAARLARVQAWPGSAIWRCAAVRAVLAAATAAVSAWQNAYQQVSPVSPSGRIRPCFQANDVSRPRAAVRSGVSNPSVNQL